MKTPEEILCKLEKPGDWLNGKTIIERIQREREEKIKILTEWQDDIEFEAKEDVITYLK